MLAFRRVDRLLPHSLAIATDHYFGFILFILSAHSCLVMTLSMCIALRVVRLLRYHPVGQRGRRQGRGVSLSCLHVLLACVGALLPGCRVRCSQSREMGTDHVLCMIATAQTKECMYE